MLLEKTKNPLIPVELITNMTCFKASHPQQKARAPWEGGGRGREGGINIAHVEPFGLTRVKFNGPEISVSEGLAPPIVPSSLNFDPSLSTKLSTCRGYHHSHPPQTPPPGTQKHPSGKSFTKSPLAHRAHPPPPPDSFSSREGCT